MSDLQGEMVGGCAGNTQDGATASVHLIDSITQGIAGTTHSLTHSLPPPPLLLSLPPHFPPSPHPSPFPSLPPSPGPARDLLGRLEVVEEVQLARLGGDGGGALDELPRLQVLQDLLQSLLVGVVGG